MKQLRNLFLVTVVAVAQFGLSVPRSEAAKPEPEAAQTEEAGLAQKPLMGWSSYSLQVYNENGIDWVSADRIKAQSDAMHEKLQPYGYKYINIDAGWNGSFDEYGRPQPKESLYPNGIKDVIDYVHNNGQKIGLYMIPGLGKEVYDQNLPIYGTPYHAQDIVALPLRTADYWGIDYKIDFSKPGAKEYIKSVADQFGEWGIDFLKFDSVTPGSGINNTSIDARDDVRVLSEALKPYNIWLELSWALDINYVETWKKYAQGWRIEWDIESYDGPGTTLTKWENIARLFPDAAKWAREAGPGGWNDFDSLNVGNGSMDGLTPDERKTAMTFWAVSSAQLYIGNDMTNLDSYGLSLLTNPEVIAVNQAGHPGHPVSMDTDQQVWYANNGDGTFSVALFNLADSAAQMKVDWNEIGLSGSASVRDLWSHTDLGTFATGLDDITLEPHASRLFKVTALNGKVSVNDDESGVSYSGSWTRNGGQELTKGSQDAVIDFTDSPSVQTAEMANVDSNAANVDTNAADTAAAAANAVLAADEANTQQSAASEANPTVSQVVYINDTDSRIVYGKEADTGSGSWGYSSGRSAEWNDYKGDVHYGEHGEVTFEYGFTGTGIEFLTEQDQSGGDIDIYLDGEFKETVSANGSPHLGQFSVYQVSGLPNGPHTLKGVMKGGSYLIVDGFKVTTDSLLAENTATFDKNDPKDLPVTLTLGGDSFTGISNGDTDLVRGTDYTVTGDTVTLRRAYLQQRQPGQTNLTFHFDGDVTQTLPIEVVQAFANSEISPEKADFDKRASRQADLPVTLQLNGNQLAGIWNGSSSLEANVDYTVGDAGVVISKAYLSTLPQGVTELTFKFSAGASASLEVTVTDSSMTERYQILNDDDSSIYYSDGWSTNGGRGFGDYMDNVHYSENNGESFEITFDGVGVQYITELDPSQGDVDIYLDGQQVATANTYAAERSAQQVVYQVSGLPEGTHTLKGVKKSGRFMLVDAIKVQLPDVISKTSFEFNTNPDAQEDISVQVLTDIGNLDGVYNGSQPLAAGEDYTVNGSTVTISKAYLAAHAAETESLRLTFAFRGDYRDDVHVTEANGDSYQYTFEGTGISLIGPTGPELGKMEVYIDGKLKGTADAYSSVRKTQQPLFSKSGLKSGTHTVKVVKTSGQMLLADKLEFDVANEGEGPNPHSTSKGNNGNHGNGNNGNGNHGNHGSNGNNGNNGSNGNGGKGPGGKQG